MRSTRLAQAALCAGGLALASCYWLAQDGELSSEYGDAVAQTDARPIVDAGSPFCPADVGSLAYCMDFDGVDAGSLGLVENDGSVATIVDGVYVSPPSSLLVTLEGDAGYGRYDVSFPLRPTTTRLEFQIRGIGVDEGVTTLAITLADPSTQTSRTLNVVVAPDGSFEVQEYFLLADGGSEIDSHSWYHVDGGAPSSWYHVVLTLTADDANRKYTSGLTVNGQVFEDDQALALAWAQGTLTLNIGATYAASGGTDFYFDDVRADFTP